MQDRRAPLLVVTLLALLLRAAAGHAGSPVTLELEYVRSVLARMEPFASAHGGIDLPVTDVWRVATGMRIPDGRTAVVSASRVGDDVRLLLVTPKRSGAADPARGALRPARGR